LYILLHVVPQVVQVQVHASDQATLGVGQGQRTALKMAVHAADLASLPRLSDDAIASGGARMYNALDFMHSKKLVHMDVKPGNILVDASGQWFLSGG
jgi:Ser/Thr protein kinase RdoA (MazF antagonist)